MLLSVYAKAYRGSTAEQIAAAADDGFEGVELRGDVDGVPLTELADVAFRDVLSAAAELGVTIVTLALGMVDGLQHNPDGLRRVGELAGVSGARVRLFSSRRKDRDADSIHAEPEAAEFADEAAALAACADAIHAAHPGIAVMLEAEPDSIGNTIARQARLIELSGADVGFNWDFVNCWMGGEYPWPAPWERLEGRLLGVHYKAARAQPCEPGRYASQCLPAQSDLPHRAMWATWAASGFAGPVTVDPHYPLFAAGDHFDPEPENPQAELCRQTLESMREMRSEAVGRAG